MSKNKNQKHTDAEHYLTQVDWQSKQLQRRTPLPWYLEPRRKYKTVSSNIATKKNFSIPILIVLIILCASIGYFLYKNDIHLLIALSVFGIIIFFAIRDTSKKPKDDN